MAYSSLLSQEEFKKLFANEEALGGARARRGDGNVQVRLVPQLRAVRLLLIEVDVIEALGGHVALVFDQRVIGTA